MNVPDVLLTRFKSAGVTSGSGYEGGTATSTSSQDTNATPGSRPGARGLGRPNRGVPNAQGAATMNTGLGTNSLGVRRGNPVAAAVRARLGGTFARKPGAVPGGLLGAGLGRLAGGLGGHYAGISPWVSGAAGALAGGALGGIHAYSSRVRHDDVLLPVHQAQRPGR